MTIESNVASSPVKLSGSGQNNGSKVKSSVAQDGAKGGSSAGGATEGGFSGLLMSMGDESQPEALQAEELRSPADVSLQVVMSDSATTDRGQTSVESLEMAQALMGHARGAIKIDSSLTSSLSQSSPKSDLTLNTASTATLTLIDLTNALPGYEKQVLKSTSGLSAASTAALPLIDQATLGEEGATQGLSKLFSKNSGLVKSSAKAGSAAEPQALAVTTVMQLEAKEFKTHQLLDLSQLMRQQSETVTVGALKETDAFKADRATDKLSMKSFASGSDVAVGYQSMVGSARSDAVLATYAASPVATEMAVAEQVNFWITQDVQRAELKLDGLGQEPVEVSIFMRGNEASVEFRSDQAETRQVLEGAVAHLKDLLRGEGLVLSGVSVGSSGHNGSNTKDQPGRQSGRKAQAVELDTSKVLVQTRPDRVTGRALDLFV